MSGVGEQQVAGTGSEVADRREHEGEDTHALETHRRFEEAQGEPEQGRRAGADLDREALGRHRREIDPKLWSRAIAVLEEELGSASLDDLDPEALSQALVMSLEGLLTLVRAGDTDLRPGIDMTFRLLGGRPAS